MKSNVIIVSLDFAKETFAEVLQPNYLDGRWYETLFVLNGCLCILCGYNVCADIWVMKQFGIIESWTNLVMIPRVAHQSVRIPTLRT
ncbi:F-box/kelch-repeat protein At3g23880-like [Rhododendron vialii]|uniref:F-box/kelch-repeat protein At3g23880-like n=1 Tax=Rhododendron vialii TaxID=182163 RepID=UPI00265DEA9F|nr:F-box/kelch-repeat protein At3g23880-like [Rhododendron vialii]